MKIILMILLGTLSFASISEKKVAGYYFGKNDFGSIDLQLNEDKTFCKKYYSFNKPCHGSGHWSGKWGKNEETVFLEYEPTMIFLDGVRIDHPGDTFLIANRKLIQVAGGHNTTFLGVKFKKSKYTMDCSRELY